MNVANPHPIEKSAPTQSTKRPYQTPALIRYGDVRVLTQGGSSSLYEAEDGNSGMCKTSSPRTICPSDRSVKENLVLIGKHPMGFGLYLFDYKASFKDRFGAARQFGVLADEVEAVMPQAVGRFPEGFKGVDYDMLGIQRVAP